VAAGVPDDLYWQCTPFERNATLRAGLIASEVRNTMRTKRTDRVWGPRDFLKEKTTVLGPEHLAGAMDAFMRTHNRQIARA
jgi:hypothetical protein